MFVLQYVPQTSAWLQARHTGIRPLPVNFPDPMDDHWYGIAPLLLDVEHDSDSAERWRSVLMYCLSGNVQSVLDE